MKHAMMHAILGIVLAAPAFSANALTYTITAGPTSSEAGATTVDFGVSPIDNLKATSGVLPAGYAGGSLFNTSTAGVAQLAARPVGSTGNFWSIGGGQTGTATFSTGLSYYGFLWGSPDNGTWNTVKFYDGSKLLASFDGTVTGVNNKWGNTEYFNVFAGQGEKITSVVLSASQNAFETDNHAFIAAVPEPDTYAMMLAGLGLIGFVARRRAL